MSKKVKLLRDKKKDRKRSWLTLLLVLAFLTGLGLVTYPWFSDYWNSFHQSRAIMGYADQVSKMDKGEYEAIINSANHYNAQLSQSGMRWTLNDEEKANYNKELAFEDSGIMGYISIPVINIDLPIYHGTSDDVLQTAIGHLEGSSLPVGGEGTHTLLSGHRGLPSAKLFTDLDKMTEGDVFTVTVLDETVTYEVDQIRIVEPTDLSSLVIEPGKDYCTLITCTPYGVNTHRILVRGHRIANIDGDAEVLAEAMQVRPIYITPFLALPIVILLVAVVLIKSKMNNGDK